MIQDILEQKKLRLHFIHLLDIGMLSPNMHTANRDTIAQCKQDNTE
jgi:hypothetical protein